MKESILFQKSFDFSKSIVNFYEKYSNEHKDNTLSKQLLRSGTSIGANIAEAQCGISRNDFISKMYIALKEANESAYWIRLLKETNLLDSSDANILLDKVIEIQRMLIATLKTVKEKMQ